MTERRWHKRNKSLNLYQWLEEGQTIEGRIVEFRDGKFGTLMVLDAADDGLVTIALKTALSDIPEQTGPGDEVRIEFKGMQKSKSGNEFYAFDWFTTTEPDPEPEKDASQSPREGAFDATKSAIPF